MKLRRWAVAAAIILTLAVLVALGSRFFTFEDGHLLLRLGEDLDRLLNSPFFSIGDFPVTPVTLIQILIYFLVLALASNAVSSVLDRHILSRTPLDEGQRYSIRRVCQYIVLMIGVIVGLDAIGLSLSSLAVFGGALGIGIGFGLQETANNFIAGIILMFERPVKVSDRIEVGEVDGRVERIGARATWVRTNDNIVIVIPNSFFITKEVINWTANDQKVRFLIPFGVSYKSDPEQVRDVVLAVAHKHPDVLSDPKPDVIFTGFGNSSIDFQLRVWTTSQVHRRPVLRSEFYFAIFRAFRENNIEIPFPQRDLHLRSADVPLSLSRHAHTQ